MMVLFATYYGVTLMKDVDTMLVREVPAGHSERYIKTYSGHNNAVQPL
jgi:hypothetical protein